MASARERAFGRLIERASGPYPDRVALVVGGVSSTYRELDAAVRSCAAALRSAGVEPGWRLPLVDDTSLLSVATLIGASRIGAAAALMNPRLTSDELGVLMEVAMTGPVGVAGDAYSALLRGTERTSVLGARELITHRAGDHEPPRPADPDKEAVVLFTSGTTGTPKAVPLPSRWCSRGSRPMPRRSTRRRPSP